MSSQELELARDLTDIIQLLPLLDTCQSTFLLRHIHHGVAQFHISALTRWLQTPTSAPLATMLKQALKWTGLSPSARSTELEEGWDRAPEVSQDEQASFVSLFKIAQLRQLMSGLTIVQLKSLVTALEPFPSQDRLRHLWDLQCYFRNELLCKDLYSVHYQFAKLPTRTPFHLSTLLPTGDEAHTLYAPLACLFGLPFPELDNLRQQLGSLSSVQLRLLIVLLFEGEPIDTFLELKDIFSLQQATSTTMTTPTPTPTTTTTTRLATAPSLMTPSFEFGEHQSTMMPFDSLSSSPTFASLIPVPTLLLSAPPPTSTISSSLAAAAPSRQQSYTLTITQQPPSETIYRRVLKPTPTVVVNRNGPELHRQQLTLVPKLLRCDNLEEIDHLGGDDPVLVQLGRPVTFPSLKILVTSHQMADSDLALRFELRADSTTLVDHIQSEAIRVISHSTQFSNRRKQQPTLTEIIPNHCVANTETRVVIVGTQFLDAGASLAVRFGTTDCPAEIRGQGTIVCVAPPAHLGVVPVFLVKDGHRLSENSLSFTYGPGRGAVLVRDD